MSARFFLLCLALCPAALLAQPLAPGEVRALPPVTAAYPVPHAASLSADGLRVAGSALPEQSAFSLDWPPAEMRAFLMTPDGYRLIEAPDSLGLLTVAVDGALSSDGAVVVGTFHFVAPDPLASNAQQRAYRWSAADGLEWLPAPVGTLTEARTASADGRFVIGRIASAGSPAGRRDVRWERGGQTLTIPPLDGDDRVMARDLSGDGSLVVGTSFPASGALFDRRAFRWTLKTGSQPIPGLEAYSTSEANAVSADGRVVVGYAYDGPLSAISDAVAFRWSQEDGLALLGTWIARDVSADGSTVGGSYQTATAVVWTVDDGARLLRDVLDAPDWWLRSIEAVSADGTILMGKGEAPQTDTDTTWRARLPVD